MFKHYFLIEYSDLEKTLISLGITKEYYEQNKDKKPPLFLLTEQVITYCNKKELKKIVENINEKNGIEVESIIKISERYKHRYREYKVV